MTQSLRNFDRDTCVRSASVTHASLLSAHCIGSAFLNLPICTCRDTISLTWVCIDSRYYLFILMIMTWLPGTQTHTHTLTLEFYRIVIIINICTHMCEKLRETAEILIIQKKNHEFHRRINNEFRFIIKRYVTRSITSGDNYYNNVVVSDPLSRDDLSYDWSFYLILYKWNLVLKMFVLFI